MVDGVSEDDLTFRLISAHDTIHLRHTVLWPDRPKSYVLLPEDDSGLHYGAFLRGAEPELVSVISFFLEDLPTAELPHGKAARFRKFATAPEHQGHGIGSLLFAFAKADVKQQWHGVESCWCDARVAAMEWYIKRGMHELGDGQGRFYKGDIPYLKMVGPMEG